MKSIRRSATLLPRPIRDFWALSFALTLLCAAVLFYNLHFRHLGYPYNLPFWWPTHEHLGQDLLCCVVQFQHLRQPDFFTVQPGISGFMYPAPMALLYRSFYAAGSHSLLVFFLITGALTLVLGAILGVSMIREGIRPLTTWLLLGSILLISYPFWFEVLLANMEFCIFLMLAFAMLAFFRSHFYLFAILVTLAGAMKLFPLVYLGLLLSQKKYRQISFAVLLFGALNLLCLRMISPSISFAFRGIQQALNNFRQFYMLRFLPEQTGYDHSLFGLIKSSLRHHFHGKMPPQLLTVYLVAVCVGGIALYFLRIRHLPVLNQLLCLCVVSILFPPTSHDYTLLHLYIPWGFLVLYAIRASKFERNIPGLRDAFLCFAVLFSAESEFIFRHARFSGQLKAIALVVLFLIALYKPFESLDQIGSPSVLAT